MKLRTLIRIAVIVSIVLLCTGFGVYSFLRMNAVENRQDFNLFTLVPQDATAVLETDRMADLMEDVDGLHCSKDEHFLYVSELFVYLKKYFNTLVGDTPHEQNAHQLPRAGYSLEPGVVLQPGGGGLRTGGVFRA